MYFLFILQIEQIQSQTEALKKSIQEYKEVTTNLVVDFTSELMKKKESIEEAKRAAVAFLRNKHVTELIKYSEEKTELLTNANNIALENCKWNKQKLEMGKSIC